MKIRFRLSDADRERYGGDEWARIDTDRLADLGYDKLAELERDIKRYDDTSIPRILAIEWPGMTMLGVRGLAWLARQVCGLDKPGWKDFKPDIIGTFFKIEDDDGGDADPLANGSSEPPSEKTPPAKSARPKKD